MKELIVIFIGGGLGSVGRYYLGKVQLGFPSFMPVGTLVVNITACLVLGVVIGLADHKQSMTATSRLFWAVGFCGGFSTFSTFSADTLQLFQKGIHSTALLYIFLSVVLCLVATVAGLYLGQRA